MSRVVLFLPVFFLVATEWLAAQDIPEAPVPGNLTADWWNYFSPAEPLDKNELSRRIEAVTSPLPPGPEVDRLKANLIRFADITTTETQAQNQPVVTPDEFYDVNSALAHYRDWRKQNAEYNSVKSDIDWQRSLTAQERVRQSEKRGAYLKLPGDAPNRYEQGLALMVSRSEIEIQELEIAQRKRDLENMTEALAGLKQELEIIPEKFVASTDDLTKWQNRLIQAKNENERTSKTISTAEQAAASRNLDSGVTASMEARRAILRRAKGSLDSGLAGLEVNRAQLAITLLKATLAAEPDPEEINQELKDYYEWSENLSKLLKETELTAERIRSSAGEQMTSAEGESDHVEFVKETLDIVNSIEQSNRQLALESAATDFLASILQDLQDKTGGWVGKAASRTRNFGSNLWDRGFNLLRFTLFEINETPVNGLGLLRVIFILLVTLFLSKIVRKGLDRFGANQKRVSKTSLYTVERLLHYVILVIGILVGLSSLGLDFTKLAIFASALGVGLGFGLQNMVSNFVAGLIVLFEKSLNVGDFVELQSGVTGEVREINMRSTLITTNDNVDMLIPNSEFVSGQVTNWTLREAYRRIRVPFGVAYGTDKELVRKAALEAADRTQWTLKTEARRQPQVWLVGFGDSSLDFELVVWLTSEAVKRPAAVHAEFLWEIETSLGQYHIEIPFPQRDLHIRSGLPNMIDTPDSEKR